MCDVLIGFDIGECIDIGYDICCFCGSECGV